MSDSIISVCLIGYGYWGKNILRNLIESRYKMNVAVAESRPEKVNGLNSLYATMKVFESADVAINSGEFDAFIVATQTPTHYDIVKKILVSGKHVMVEKPLTTSLAQAIELNCLAEKLGLILMVDHIFLYHPVVQKMKTYFDENYLGKITYIDATRINLGIYQRDVSVLWDLACHDISIVNYLIEEKPNAVRAIGRMNLEHGTQDLAYLFLYYPSGLLVQINASWASPVKMRKMIVGGEKRMLIYDDIEPTNKLTIYEYEHNIELDELKTILTDYRLSNIIIPKIEPTEALQNALVEFYQCIKTGKQPLTDCQNAIEVISVLEKAQQSLTLGGALVPML